MKKLVSQISTLVPFRDQEYTQSTVYYTVMIVLLIQFGSLNQVRSKSLLCDSDYYNKKTSMLINFVIIILYA